MIKYRVLLFILMGLGVCLPEYSFGQITFGGKQDKFELNYAVPQKFEIGGLKATGVKFLDPNALISITGLKVGDEISIPGDEITNALKKLWSQGILGDVEVVINKIEGNYVFLEFRLQERPRLSKFEFKGVRKGEADDIRDQIRLIRGKVITDALIANTKNSVRKYYVKKGFRNTSVNIIEKEDTNVANSSIISIQVDKGERVKIEDIVFEGNKMVSSNKLKRKMKETKTQKPYRIFKASKLLDGAYAKDKQSIIEYYNSIGHRDAEIVSDTIINLNEERVKIKMKIDEGDKYYFGDITWSGNFLYSSDTLGKILDIKRGDIYSKETLDKKLNFNPNGLDITSLYMDDGYLFFNIVPVEVKVDSNYIDIEMRMYEGDQATVNEIVIKGNTVTNDHVIRREIYTLPGQKFSRSDLIRTQRALSQLGYFNPETIGINPIPDPQTGNVDIEFSLEEKPSNQITLSGGWGGFQGFVGTLGLVYTNFSARNMFKLREWTPLPSGDGQRLSIQAQSNGLRYQNYAFSFTEPWLGGRRPNSLTVSLNRTNIRNIRYKDNRPYSIGSLHISGVNAYLAQRLRKPDNYFSLTNAIGYNQYTNVGDYQLPIVDKGVGYSLYEAKFNTFNYTITLARNSIDNPTYPRSGSQFSISGKFTPPFSFFRSEPDPAGFESTESYLKEKYKWVEYHKWNLDFSFYTPLSRDKKKRLVLMNKANFGVIGSYSRGLGTGPFERFVLGGTGLFGAGGGFGTFLLGQDYIGLRGYPDNSSLLNHVDREEYVVSLGETLSNPGGGIAFTKFTSELRFLVSDNPMATIYGLGFFEAGNNFLNYDEINPFKTYKSFGAGIRLYMPMFGGLIGYDIAFPLDDPMRDNPFEGGPRGHFSLGMPLR